MISFDLIWGNIVDYYLILQSSFTIYSILDIAIVAFLLYFLLLFLKETRALGIIFGLLLLGALWFLGQKLQLKSLNEILRWMITSLLVALPVIFQPELRSGLEKLGRTTHLATDFRRLSKTDIESIVDEIVKSLTILSKNSYGALIIIARQTGLSDVINSGELILSQVSAKLITNIFTPKAPLHDGAIVIKGNKIISASCTLPLDEDLIDLSLGTRHKAALSLSRQSDALVLIVSEESGAVSISYDGKIHKVSDFEELKKNIVKLIRATKKDDK